MFPNPRKAIFPCHAERSEASPCPSQQAFAELTLSAAKGLRVTRGEATCVAHWKPSRLGSAWHEGPLPCHAGRSEASPSPEPGPSLRVTRLGTCRGEPRGRPDPSSFPFAVTRLVDNSQTLKRYSILLAYMTTPGYTGNTKEYQLNRFQRGFEDERPRRQTARELSTSSYIGQE